MSDAQIDGMEDFLGISMDYLREMKRCSPEGFDKFMGVLPISSHREVISPEAHFVSHFLASRREDCGPCTQISINVAVKQGIDKNLIQAVIDGQREQLDDDLGLIYDFTEAVLDNSLEQMELRQAVEARLGAAALVDLGLAIAVSRVFPTVKRAMGFADTCVGLTVDGGKPQWKR